MSKYTINVETATREQLADELGAAGEYTEDWETADINDLRSRARMIVAMLVRTGDRVSGGIGEDQDTGRVIELLDDGMVLVAWDSGIRTPAVAADLTRE